MPDVPDYVPTDVEPADLDHVRQIIDLGLVRRFECYGYEMRGRGDRLVNRVWWRAMPLSRTVGRTRRSQASWLWSMNASRPPQALILFIRAVR